MNLETWTIYVVTVLALLSTPGPSHLLMLSNSMVNGFSRSVFTAIGDLNANALQMLAAGLGLAAVIVASAQALTIIKWLGVAYLLWLGIRMVLSAGKGAAQGAADRSPSRRRVLWMQGFMTSAANPKAVVFFAALFPQFLSAEHPFWPQFLILSVTYIAIDGLFLCAYGLSADWIAKRFKGSARTWIERAGGGFMIAAAVLLGLKTATER